MEISLKGKVVVVTGAESGIGRSIALACADAGASICAAGLVSEGLNETVREAAARTDGKTLAVITDISSQTQVENLFDRTMEEFGRIDAVVANAGVGCPDKSIFETTLDDWKRVIDINLTGTFLTVSTGARHLVRQGNGGSILATGSSTAVRVRANSAPYVASKGGVHTLMQAMALELAPLGIRVNTIVPGTTNTPIIQSIVGYRERVEPTLPMKQVAEPDEHGRLVAFAISDLAPHMTGSHLKIDSGRTIG